MAEPAEIFAGQSMSNEDDDSTWQDSRLTQRKILRAKIPTQSSLGQFAFGPATQTTIVTTTTTTTTKFPPFVLPEPKRVQALDPRQYPLAQSPTPAALRNIGFVLDGKAVVFKEAKDVDEEIDRLVEEQNLLQRRNGFIQHVKRSGSIPEECSPSIRSSKSRRDRLASPDSADELSAQPTDFDSTSLRKLGKQRATRSPARSHPRLRAFKDDPPTTPDLKSRHNLRKRYDMSDSFPPAVSNILPTPAIDYTDQNTEDNELDEVPIDQSPTNPSRIISRASYDSAVPTPPIEPHDRPIQERRLSTRAISSIPARLHMSASPSIQDGTLPSPSLSPVTAGLGHTHEYFADIDSASDFGSQPGYGPLRWSSRESGMDVTPRNTRYESPAMTEAALSDDDLAEENHTSRTTVRDIPSMLDFFEALPEAMKSYAMHQLLRRCPKQTLQVVADIVNPVLKCDFLTLLPTELGMNIVRYLDVQSLCRASQVSKKWRSMINSDEKAWKQLFDNEGFNLPDGELQQAIIQGWGWQDPVGIDGCEVDMSHSNFLRSDSEPSSPVASSSRKWTIPTLRRSKRKAAAQMTNRSKQIKTHATSRESSIDPIISDWMSQLSTAQGPNNAANAAIMAVPNPNLPLPSLKGLHLYKSLYRRHYSIRKNWMSEETKPHHIAFRAHGSHVVTCLQFDTDKILTGSDDSNINVYDTKTGKLKKLLRGHEGGVWALEYMGNTLVSGSTDRSVRVWDIETGRETHVFRGHTSTVRCLQILQPTKVGTTADGKAIMMPKQPLIITGSRDSTLRIWKLPKVTDPTYLPIDPEADLEDNPFFIRALTGHQHSVRAIAAHADTLVSGSYDSTVRVWKISTGETVHRLSGHASKVYSVVLDTERNRCISGSMDYLVKIWSLETGSALYTLEGHTSLVGLLDLNCDRLVSAAADTSLRIWDPENGQCKATLTAHTGAITCFQHDAQKVISGSDRTLKMWDIKTGYCKKDLLADLSGVWQVKFNDRRCVAAVQRDSMTFIEVLDFGAARDGIPEKDRGRRIVVDEAGRPVESEEEEEISIVDS